MELSTSMIGALAAVAGSIVGGCASVAATFVGQRIQFRGARLAAELEEHEELYGRFVGKAVALFVDAIERSAIDPGKLMALYAIVARIHDNLTGQPVIIIAGIMGPGTEAAGEVLYNNVYLDSLLQKAPKDWEQKNLEAVIQTDVVENHPGPPTILAVESW